MKILWLSNIVLSNDDKGLGGAWLGAMAKQLIASGAVTLGNITSGKVLHITCQNCGAIKQWIVPTSPVNKNGLPSRGIVDNILKVVEEFSPDIVHVWGTELYWGLLTARKLIKQPALLEIQGLKFAIASVFAGGLSLKEQLACIGLKEILRGTTIPQEQLSFEKWGLFEKKIITGHRYITVQSDWAKAHVTMINPECLTFFNNLILRMPFYESETWKFSQKPILFCSAAYPAPFKGLHLAIRAVALLKKKFPGIQLRIAGGYQRLGLRKDGYITWLNQETKKLNVHSNIVWLGSLQAPEIINEMHLASAMILPSFIENCCNAMQEAMMIGVPLVVSYAGGLPSLARDEESALFFPPGDESMCARKMERLLTDQDLARRLSQNARAVAIKRNDPAKIVAHQLEIYRQVIAASKGKQE
jgi:glycosyltransferase involved in cell wall biosynthesis